MEDLSLSLSWSRRETSSTAPYNYRLEGPETTYSPTNCQVTGTRSHTQEGASPGLMGVYVGVGVVWGDRSCIAVRFQAPQYYELGHQVRTQVNLEQTAYRASGHNEGAHDL